MDINVIDNAVALSGREISVAFDPALLEPATVREIRLDLTTRCNLRCVYCLVSQKNYVGEDMPVTLRNRVAPLINNLCVHNDPHTISVNGHGETTYMDGWDDICRDMLDHGLSIAITSNLAKEYTQAELEVLGSMKAIAISIDTADRALLRRMRRKVDIRQIVMNIMMIRAASLRMDCRPPNIHFLCGLYDKNSLHIEGLSRLAVALKVHMLSFWNLTAYPMENTDVPKGDEPIPLDQLSIDELRPRVAAIRRAVELARNNGLGVEVHANFVDDLARRAGIDG
jgi:MoaA/NifB/PqqE/SkfB family radical SAM enzyme